ncbi:uncharacterized protein TNIN_174841 [Trichonephila inaurata madagascariensis]|uniref:Uncharacterized protein n=1 Tax=Trichonephila inaurata madagascariensis TaxID=2747483 RepID=A0A8X6XPY5_9ARAC|nr:uncharacterized protein TNIN_174841 [Trichonephila inaurata madagascariensis]
MSTENLHTVLSENFHSKSVENINFECNENATLENKKCTEVENIENTSTSNEDECSRTKENINIEEYSVELTNYEKQCLRKTENESDRNYSTSVTKSEIECFENAQHRCEIYSNTSTLSENEHRENNETRNEKYSNASTVSEKEFEENNECSGEIRVFLNTSTISEKDSIVLIVSEIECPKGKESSDEILNASTTSGYLEKCEIINFQKYSDISMASENEFLGVNESMYPGNKESSDSEKNEHLQNGNSQRQPTVTLTIFPQFIEPVQNEISTGSINRYFCCGSLTDGAVASADYTIVLSVIFILISCHHFFRSGGDEEGSIKTLCFCSICYAICYIKCGLRMKLAIEEERRDKLVPWIIFSIITIFSLLSGIIYICMNNWVYCTWGVVRLFKSMGFGSRNSVMDGIRMFTYGVAV